MSDSSRLLRVFLCHASSDKAKVQKLYSRLISDGVDAWLDKEKLIPGQNWQIEIPKAVRNADVVVVCLSSQSVNKEGFVQREIKIALDAADEKPEGTIFIIPARLEECNVPERISQFHWVDLFSDNGYEWLLKALYLRANTLGAVFEPLNKESPKNKMNNEVDGEEFHKEERFNNQTQQDKVKSSDIHNAKEKILIQINELKQLQKNLEKPVNIVALIAAWGFYFLIFGAAMYWSAAAIFGTDDSVVFFSGLGITVITSLMVVRKLYLDREKQTKESKARILAEIQNKEKELQSMKNKS